MTSDFATEVAIYPQSSSKSPKAQNSVRAYRLAPLATQFVLLVMLAAANGKR